MAAQQNISPVQWAAPSMLRNGNAMNMQKPILLGFQSDTFMRDFMAVVKINPAQIKDYIAKPESFRKAPLGIGWLAPHPSQLKLYLPVHGCFYLILASLVDIVPGTFTDHPVSFRNQEKAGFVLRRLAPDGKEMAWVSDPTKSPPSNKTWQELSADQQTKSVPNETLSRLFQMPYQENGQQRFILAGFVATTSKETYQESETSTQELPKIDPKGETLYVLRCIYQRPQVPDLVSDTSEPFLIASPSDADAPSRPINIPPPMNTVAEVLRALHL
jgi:hypothetical protein